MTLCDASALIALINRSDANHQRCVNVLSLLPAPLITTWPCLTESMYLLGTYGGWLAQRELWSYLIDNILVLYYINDRELKRMLLLMEQYQDLPMDLGDASLVATAETLNQKRIFTLDQDFYVYRFKRNQTFEVVP